jgi:hypothetical protein
MDTTAYAEGGGTNTANYFHSPNGNAIQCYAVPLCYTQAGV